jgi:hypothetical protein
MLSCGDAKKGGGGYSIKMTGPSGRRISRQFFVKTTTSVTTLRYFVSILEDSLSSKICRLFWNFIEILEGGLYFTTIGEIKVWALLRFDLGSRVMRGKMLVPLFHQGKCLHNFQSASCCRHGRLWIFVDLSSTWKKKKKKLGIFLRHLLVSHGGHFWHEVQQRLIKIYRLTSLKEEKSPEFSW